MTAPEGTVTTLPPGKAVETRDDRAPVAKVDALIAAELEALDDTIKGAVQTLNRATMHKARLLATQATLLGTTQD